MILFLVKAHESEQSGSKSCAEFESRKTVIKPPKVPVIQKPQDPTMSYQCKGTIQKFTWATLSITGLAQLQDGPP